MKEKNRSPIRLLAMALMIALLLPHYGAAAAEEQPVNVLLIGVDSLTLEKPGRSDTMLLLSIRPETGQVRIVSFMRDLYLPIEGVGKNRLNAAYFYGGSELLCATLEKQFGITIHHTATVSFQLMVDLIDRMGGLTLTLKKEELKPLNAQLNSYNKKVGLPRDTGKVTAAGEQTLTGAQVLAYSRIRSIDSDFQRVNRQQKVIMAVLEKLKQADFFTMVSMVATGMRHVETDMSLWDINRLIPIVLKKDLQLETARVPFDGLYSNQTINGMQVLVPDMEENRRRVKDFLEK